MSLTHEADFCIACDQFVGEGAAPCPWLADITEQEGHFHGPYAATYFPTDDHALTLFARDVPPLCAQRKAAAAARSQLKATAQAFVLKRPEDSDGAGYEDV